MLGATIVALVLTALLAVESIQRPMGPAWLAAMAIAMWIGVFVLALPSAAIIFSVLWPVTRRRTAASNAVCLIAGATGGIILAPLASSKMQGASIGQILLFAAIGATVALIYLAVAARLGHWSSASILVEIPPRVSHQLDLGQ